MQKIEYSKSKIEHKRAVSAQILDKELTNMDTMGPTKKMMMIEEKNKQIAFRQKEKDERHLGNLERVIKHKEDKIVNQDREIVEKDRITRDRLNEIEKGR